MKIKEKYRSFYYATMDEVPEPRIDPKKTALLLVDLQNEFVLRDFGEALQFKAAGEWDRWVPFHDRLDDIVIPNNKKLLDFFRRNRMTVTYGRIACLREDGEDRSPVQKSEGWNGMLLPVNSYAAQIIDPLKPQENEIVVNKTTDSVTTGTNYLTLLQFMGIETVVVTGIVTDQCVACTVRGLADAGYKVTCAVLVLPLCFIYAEMTSMMPYAGGQNIWVTNALGWNVGFGACWLVMLLYVMAMPTVAYGIASMVGYLVPIDALQTKIMAAVILVVWFFLSNKEMKLLARLQNILFWSTLAVSLAASLIFVFSGHWSFQTMEPIFPNGFSGYTAAVALLIMKFVGFDLIPQLSEEAKFPKKDLWKAFVGSLGCTVLIYGMAVVGVGGIVTTDRIINTDIVDPPGGRPDRHALAGRGHRGHGRPHLHHHPVLLLAERLPHPLRRGQAAPDDPPLCHAQPKRPASDRQHRGGHPVHLFHRLCPRRVGELHLCHLRPGGRLRLPAGGGVLPQAAQHPPRVAPSLPHQGGRPAGGPGRRLLRMGDLHLRHRHRLGSLGGPHHLRGAGRGPVGLRQSHAEAGPRQLGARGALPRHGGPAGGVTRGSVQAVAKGVSLLRQPQTGYAPEHSSGAYPV